MNNPLISIIVPVYKAEKYIHRCLGSIESQIFTDWECILVDDGSPDNSGVICDEYSKKDERFVTIHKENGGASSARNNGIDIARSEYICFIDADDEVTENYLSDLLTDSQSCDLVIHGMTRIENTKTIDRGMHINGLFDLDQNPQVFFDKINIERYGGPVCKLFKASIIRDNNILFDEKIKLAEDLDFLLNYLALCSVVKTEVKNNYLYYATEGSATTKLYLFETELYGAIKLDKSWENLNNRFPSDKISALHKASLRYYMSRILPAVASKETTLHTVFGRLRSIPQHIFESYGMSKADSPFFLRILSLLVRWDCKHLLAVVLYFRFRL